VLLFLSIKNEGLNYIINRNNVHPILLTCHYYLCFSSAWRFKAINECLFFYTSE